MKYENKTYGEERALYGLMDSKVIGCRFDGEEDGESALKECRDITVNNCEFSLRYPLWHAERFSLANSSMDTGARAPIWYCSEGKIKNCSIDGTKFLRECHNISVTETIVNSDEFGWKCESLDISDSEINSAYCLFDSKNVSINNLRMTGKYSFQYIDGLTIRDSYLDTKDAFWHSKNITVENTTLKGEYLAWFSEGLTLKNCHIIGTQPFCYCKDLKLIDCTMEGTDLSFEYSDVEADVIGHIDSVKNIRSGYVRADSIGEIINEDSVIESNCEIIVK
jgi:hypothetical protein